MIKNKVANKHISNLISDEKEFKEVFMLLGELDNQIIPSSIRIIESKLNELGYSKSMVSRAKFVCIELLENMMKHQDSKHSLTPYFEFSIAGDIMKFVTGNSVSEERTNSLRFKLDSYEKMTEDEIISVYMEKLKKGDLDEKGNAGLGLLSILKRSNKNYKFSFEKINDKEYYFNSVIKL